MILKDKSRDIIISDIHGCIDEFNELLKALVYNKKKDRVILLGDLIDRGNDSVAVVKKARELGLESVRGNHEHKFLKWFRSSGSRLDVYGRHPHYSKFSDADITYMSNMPFFIKLEDTIIVHAGLKPNLSLENQSKDDMMYLRYTDLNKKFISVKKVLTQGVEASGAHFWTEFWAGPESIVYGHNVHSLTEPLVEEVSPNVFCYGLDTGCCFGGRLTAMILETKEIIQVQAKQTYYKQGFNK